MIIKIKNNVHENIRYIFMLLPLFWVIGIEQFIFPVLVIILMAKNFLLHGANIRIGSGMQFYFGWAVIAVISILTIEESYRYLTWVRNIVILLTGLALSYLVYDSVRTLDSVIAIVKTIVVFAVLSSLGGLTAAMNLKFEFISPVGHLLLKVGNSGYLQQMATKSFSFMEALWFESGFVRPKGLMLYPNLLGGLLFVGAILKYALMKRSPGLKWWVILIPLWFVDAVVIVYTLSRSAWIGGAAAALLVLFVVQLGVRQKALIMMAFTCILGIAVFFGASDIMEKRFVEKAHSNEERGKNYELIYEALIDNPVNFLIGHGSQRDSADLLIPLGSHSTYLGIAYKYGVMGITLFALGLLLTYRRSIRAIKRMHDARHKKMSVCLLAAFTVMTVQGLFIELDVDAVYGYIWWLILGLLMSLTAPDLRVDITPANRLASQSNT